jgi:hypothetical protein
MYTVRAIAPLTTFLFLSLISCASVTPTELSISPQPTQPPSTVANNPNPEIILNEVISRQPNLQVCEFSFDPEAARQFSKVYLGKEGQHLVQLLCFMAAYQGRFAFLQVDTSQPEMQIQPLELEMAGFPEFNFQTNILSNAYKFIGAGTCTQETQHYWRDETLKLISSEIIDQQPNACEKLGVRSPSAEQLITPQNIGPAKLGMTLGQLKQVLGAEARFAPTKLGVDAGEGIKVIQEGTLQYMLGFTTDEQQPTDNSVINSITVANPDYRINTGVGPGTLLKQVVAVYGPVTLSYNWNNEGREYIEFQQGLGSGVWIRSNQWTITDFAGIYPDTKAEFNQTQQYHEHAGIGSITISQ